MNTQQMKARTKTFAIRIIAFAETLPPGRANDIIAGQIIRSGTGTGSNYRSACRARSKKDFVSKIGIAEEEADETMYWLELIKERGVQVDKVELEWLLKESDEITAILTSSGRTAKAGLDR